MTHPLYEEARLPGTPPDRVAELSRQQDEIFARVPRPDGAPGLKAPPFLDRTAATTGAGAAQAGATADRLITARETGHP